MISVPARLSVSDGAGWIQQAETYVRRDRGTRNTSVHAKEVSAHYAQLIEPELSLHSSELHEGRQGFSCVFRFLSRLLGYLLMKRREPIHARHEDQRREFLHAVDYRLGVNNLHRSGALLFQLMVNVRRQSG